MKKERFFKYTGKNANNFTSSCFTVNRLYKLVRLDLDMDNWIVVIDDEGDEYCLSSTFFMEVTEENINLNKKLDELEVEIAQVKKAIEVRDTYKAGDIVVLVSKRPNTWNYDGEMDEFLGKTVKLTYIGKTVKLTYIGKTSINFDGSKRWDFSLSDIERKATTEEIDVFENTKLPNIGGYEGEDRGTSIAYGCKSMNKTTLASMKGDGVTSFIVGGSSFTGQGSPVTEEEFTQIFNYIKKTK